MIFHLLCCASGVVFILFDVSVLFVGCMLCFVCKFNWCRFNNIYLSYPKLSNNPSQWDFKCEKRGSANSASRCLLQWLRCWHLHHQLSWGVSVRGRKLQGQHHCSGKPKTAAEDPSGETSNSLSPLIIIIVVQKYITAALMLLQTPTFRVCTNYIQCILQTLLLCCNFWSSFPGKLKNVLFKLFLVLEELFLFHIHNYHF